MRAGLVFTSLVLTVLLSLCFVVHRTQGSATMSASASAGSFSCYAEAVPGISGVETYDRGEGYTGTGSAYADVMGDTDSTVDKAISARCDEYTHGYQHRSGYYIEYTEKFVDSRGAKEGNYGMPYSDKWASANGTCGAYDAASASYDSPWW